jgi:hypothetical protein
MTAQDPFQDGIDITRTNVARIYDYLLGGKDNFTVPRRHRHHGKWPRRRRVVWT